MHIKQRRAIKRKELWKILREDVIIDLGRRKRIIQQLMIIPKYTGRGLIVDYFIIYYGRNTGFDGVQ